MLITPPSLQEDALIDTPLLILANKQDLPSALSPEEVAKKLGFGLEEEEEGEESEKTDQQKRMRERGWWVEGTCAVEGVGLKEGIDRIMDLIENPMVRVKNVKKAR